MKKLILIYIFSFAVTLGSFANLPVISLLENVSGVFSGNNEPGQDDSDAKFTIYLNQNILNIKYSKPSELINAEAVVYNLLGKEVTRKKLDNVTLNQITLSAQNTCYIVRINYSGKVFTRKVIASPEN